MSLPTPSFYSGVSVFILIILHAVRWVSCQCSYGKIVSVTYKLLLLIWFIVFVSCMFVWSIITHDIFIVYKIVFKLWRNNKIEKNLSILSKYLFSGLCLRIWRSLWRYCPSPWSNLSLKRNSFKLVWRLWKRYRQIMYGSSHNIFFCKCHHFKIKTT